LTGDIKARPFGTPLRPWQNATIIGVTFCVGTITAVAPLVFAKMVAEGRLTTAQIGPLATSEYLVQAFSIAIYGALLRPDWIRTKTILAVAGLFAANVISAWAPLAMLLPVRMFAGACEGLIVWLMSQMLARSPVPARLQGIYLGALGTSGLLFSATYSAWVVPTFGSAGSYLGLALLAGAAGLLVPFIPSKMTPLPGGGKLLLPTKMGIFGLLSVFMIFAGTVGIWIYLPSLAVQQARPAWVIGVAVPAALAMQVVGGLAASAMATRLPAFGTLVVVWSVYIVLAAICLSSPPAWLFILCVAMHGFCWMFFIPFQMTLLIALDPSRRSTLFLSTADATGAGAGPGLVSLAVIGTDVRGAVMIGALLFIVGIVMITILNRRRRSPGDVPALL
jgi:MFS family permease